MNDWWNYLKHGSYAPGSLNRDQVHDLNDATKKYADTKKEIENCENFISERKQYIEQLKAEAIKYSKELGIALTKYASKPGLFKNVDDYDKIPKSERPYSKNFATCRSQDAVMSRFNELKKHEEEIIRFKESVKAELKTKLQGYGFQMAKYRQEAAKNHYTYRNGR